MKTVLITGASSGIGKETATLFAQHGWRVVAAARRLERMADLRALGCLTVALDVTDEAGMQQAFATVEALAGPIDVLVNNAGFSQNGFVEELSLAQLRYQFEVNVFGLLRLTQLVLPSMRAAGRGTIINVGSAGGDFTAAGASAYHATKYALESFSDGLRQELGVFGIHVVLVKPGGVATEFVSNAEDSYPPPIAGNPYERLRTNFQAMLKTVLTTSTPAFPILPPRQVAQAIYDSARQRTPPSRVRVGRTARLLPVVKRLLSDRAFDKLILTQLGLLKP